MPDNMAARPARALTPDHRESTVTLEVCGSVAADRHVREADVANQAGRDVHVRPGVGVLRRAATARPRAVAPCRELQLPARLMVGAQRQRIFTAVPIRRPGLPGRPAAGHASAAAAVAYQ